MDGPFSFATRHLGSMMPYTPPTTATAAVYPPLSVASRVPCRAAFFPHFLSHRIHLTRASPPPYAPHMARRPLPPRPRVPASAPRAPGPTSPVFDWHAESRVTPDAPPTAPIFDWSRGRTGGPCTVRRRDGSLCDHLAHARGYCSLHYDHWLRFGDPLGGVFRESRPRRGVLDRFHDALDKDGPSHDGEPGAEEPCWIWTRSRNPQGYGQFSVKGRNVSAHRFAWEIVAGHGPPPEGSVVRQRCGNRACANPRHLYLGTYREIGGLSGPGRGAAGHDSEKR